jgi:hypothetical protein
LRSENASRTPRLVVVLRNDVLERREDALDETRREAGRIGAVADAEPDEGPLADDLHRVIGVGEQPAEHVEGLARHDRVEVALFTAALAAGHREPAPVGGDHAKLLALTLEQHAADRVAAVLDRGGEERATDHLPKASGVDREARDVVRERPDSREVADLVPEDLEVARGTADVQHGPLGLEGDGVVAVEGPHDLIELVRGHQALARLANLDGTHAERQSGFAIGAGDRETLIAGRELETGEHRSWTARGDHAAGEGEAVDEG